MSSVVFLFFFFLKINCMSMPLKVKGLDSSSLSELFSSSILIRLPDVHWSYNLTSISVLFCFGFFPRHVYLVLHLSLVAKEM